MRISTALLIALIAPCAAHAQQVVPTSRLDPLGISSSLPGLYVPNMPDWNTRVRPWVEHSSIFGRDVIRMGPEWNSQLLNRLWFVTSTTRNQRVAGIRSTKRLNIGFALNLRNDWRLKAFAQSDTSVRRTRFLAGVSVRF